MNAPVYTLPTITPAPVEPDFVVVDVETACSRVSSICQIGIVGFKDGTEIFEYETLVDPLDRFLGAPRDGALARHLAAEGARIVAAVGSTTTMLVISNDQPFGRFFAAHAEHRKAEEMRRSGTVIEIIPEDEIRARTALALAS